MLTDKQVFTQIGKAMSTSIVWETENYWIIKTRVDHRLMSKADRRLLGGYSSLRAAKKAIGEL